MPWMPLILIIDKRKDDVTLGAAALQKQNSCTEPNYQRTLMQKDVVIQELKKRGCRITKQRRMLLDVILENECSCCKEIYYKAVKKDPKIGAATVYRMVNTLEEIGAINRKNMYRITCDENDNGGYTVRLNDDSSINLSESKWSKIIESGLEACGYIKNQKITSVVDRKKAVSVNK